MADKINVKMEQKIIYTEHGYRTRERLEWVRSWELSVSKRTLKNPAKIKRLIDRSLRSGLRGIV